MHPSASPTWHDMRMACQETLATAGIEEASIEATYLIQDIFDVSSAFILTHANEPIPSASNPLWQKLKQSTQKRASGIPLAYVLQRWVFRKTTYTIMKGVLIPRPETELLVDIALKKIHQTNPTHIVELGYGSGVISCELALDYPAIPIIGWDISPFAYTCASNNIHTLGIKNISIYLGDFFEQFPRWLQQMPDCKILLVSNPPYIPTDTIAGLDPVVTQHEPHLALDGGKDGLDFYTKLMACVPQHIPIIVEIGIDQSPAITVLSHRYGRDPIFYDDLQGIPRVCSIVPL